MRRKAKISNLNHIENLLINSSKSLENKELKNNMTANLLWREVAGDKTSENSYVLKYENKILFVACKSSVWTNELSLMKKNFLEKIKESPFKIKVNDIFFTVKKIKKDEIKNNSIDSKEVNQISLTEEEIFFAEKLAKNAKNNPELAEIIKKTYISSLKASKLKERL